MFRLITRPSVIKPNKISLTLIVLWIVAHNSIRAAVEDNQLVHKVQLIKAG